MKLNELFNNDECKIYKVINFYESESIEGWELEKTDYILIPESNDTLYDAYFVVKAYLVDNAKIESCFIDLTIPERISEFAFRMKDGNLVIQNIIGENLEVIPSMASEQYGDPELYLSRSNPRIGIEVLKEGKRISSNSSAIIDDLAYIYEECEINESTES